jgi:hypothetical protein
VWAKLAKHFLWPTWARRFAGVGWSSKPAVSANFAAANWATANWQAWTQCWFDRQPLGQWRRWDLSRVALCRLMRFWRHESKVVERVGVAASLTATGATTEDAACGWCAPPAVALRPHLRCWPVAGQRRTSSQAARVRLRAGNEPLPADDASARRWRRTWTCDHYSGRRGHFLDGSLGIFARVQQNALNAFAEDSAKHEPASAAAAPS